MNSPTEAEISRDGMVCPRASALIAATFAVAVTFRVLTTALVVGRLYANDRVESLRSFPGRIPIAGTREAAARGGEIRTLFEQFERQREGRSDSRSTR